MRAESTSPVVLARVVIAILVALAGIAAGPQTASTSYSDIVELYRRGDDELALQKLGALTNNDITRGRDALLHEFDNAQGAKFEHVQTMIRAAALLHTVRALAARAHADDAEYRVQFTAAEIYIEQLVTRERPLQHRLSPFVETWRLFVIASYHGQMGVKAARDFGRHARQEDDSALWLLALGASEEMGWSLHQEEDAPPSVDGDLKEAERDYRWALVMSPELVEARLRLGRVLALRKDDEAVKTLEQIGEAIEAPYRYLARLFQGDLYERAGKLPDAERQYLAAVAVMPALAVGVHGARPCSARARRPSAVGAGRARDDRARRAFLTRRIRGSGTRAARPGGVRCTSTICEG